MTPTVNRCLACGHLHYPPRLLCPVCHGAHFASEPVAAVRVEAVTRLHRHSDPARLKLDLVQVRGPGGLILLARAEGPVAVGQQVALSLDSQGALVAHSS